jgi:hypothetical protein
MKIEYDLTKQDYIDFNMHYIENSPKLKRSLFIQRFVIALVFLIFPFIFSKNSGTPFLPSFIVYGVIFILWVLFYPKYYRTIAKKRIIKLIDKGGSAIQLGHRSITLNEEGLEEFSEQGESKSSWSSIERIEETENHIYIFIGSTNAYLVPIRAFEGRTQKDEFMERLKNKK